MNANSPFDERCGPVRRRHHEVQRRGPMAIRYYVRARLHRRLFVTLGLAIVLMLVAAFTVTHFFFPHSEFPAKRHSIEALFRDQFAENWSRPTERTRFADATEQAFGTPITLVGDRGETLSTHGGGCAEPHIVLRIERDAKFLGEVRACAPRTAAETKKALWAGFLASCLVLWIAAGMLAHRFGRPLWQLVQVTRELGEGRLESRARLGRHQPGEVGILAESINDMAERIEKQVSDQRELLAAVSHEIRTPLARMNVITELLRDGSASAPLISDLEREIAEIDDLTGQLLATSKLDFGALVSGDVSLVELGLEAVVRMSLDASLVSAPEDDSLEVRGDATLLSRALRNILHNAVTHGEALSSVEFSRDRGRVIVRVFDKGPGFKDEERSRIFEPFVRGQGSKKSKSSLGLGLALVRRIILAHRGDVFAENAPSGGGVVGFWLPIP